MSRISNADLEGCCLSVDVLKTQKTYQPRCISVWVVLKEGIGKDAYAENSYLQARQKDGVVIYQTDTNEFLYNKPRFQLTGAIYNSIILAHRCLVLI